MIEAAITAFGGGSAITAFVGLIVKLWDRKQEDEERKHLLRGQMTNLQIKALNATAHRTNNWAGNFVRICLALIPQGIMLAILYIGYRSPETIIWISHQNSPKEISLLFGLLDISIPSEINWRSFNGIVIIPVMFAQMGAVNTYYLLGGFFSRR